MSHIFLFFFSEHVKSNFPEIFLSVSFSKSTNHDRTSLYVDTIFHGDKNLEKLEKKLSDTNGPIIHTTRSGR